jgi:hypothetical protein
MAFVFTKLDGTPLQPQNVSQAFGNIIRRDGLPTIRLHGSRTTLALCIVRTMLARRTRPLETGRRTVVPRLRHPSKVELHRGLRSAHPALRRRGRRLRRTPLISAPRTPLFADRARSQNERGSGIMRARRLS